VARKWGFVPLRRRRRTAPVRHEQTVQRVLPPAVTVTVTPVLNGPGAPQEGLLHGRPALQSIDSP
jgi:hypothetical protein